MLLLNDTNEIYNFLLCPLFKPSHIFKNLLKLVCYAWKGWVIAVSKTRCLFPNTAEYKRYQIQYCNENTYYYLHSVRGV